MIHPHLKTDEELLDYWKGDFHDKDEIQALEQLARRKVGNFCDILKTALENEEFDEKEIRWTFFEYIYDNAFVIEYVNHPKPNYNVEKAIFYIEWAIPNDFSFAEYVQLSDEAKDELKKYFLDQLKNINCDFEDYIKRHHLIPDLLMSFDDTISHVLKEGYLDYLRKDNDFVGLMTFDNLIAEIKEGLHTSFIEWLYGKAHSAHCYKSTKSPLVLIPYDYKNSLLLSKLREIIKRNKLSLDTMPDVFISLETPPSFKLLKYHDVGDGSNLFDTENLLGYYIPSKQEIRLLELGIQKCANYLQVDADLLREIVFIHELGHYMQHKMPCYQTKEWDDVLYNNSYSPIDLLEGWAQLMDAWVVVNEYLSVFKKLTDRQSAPYNVYKNYSSYSARRILESLDGLRQLGSPAKIQDWDKLIQ